MAEKQVTQTPAGYSFAHSNFAERSYSAVHGLIKRSGKSVLAVFNGDMSEFFVGSGIGTPSQDDWKFARHSNGTPEGLEAALRTTADKRDIQVMVIPSSPEGGSTIYALWTKPLKPQ